VTTKAKWVIWWRPKGSKDSWALRTGRYASMTATEDALKHLRTTLPSCEYLGLTEGRTPQISRRSERAELG